MTHEHPGAARLLDGRACARAVRAESESQLARLAEHGVQPGLAVIRVGDDPASETYVRSKRRAADRVGISATEYHLASDIGQADLEALIDRLNADDTVDGILLQLPIPEHLRAAPLIERIDPTKDVDGFHPINVGKMLTGGHPHLLPCTPRGIMELLRRNDVTLEGREAVVIGRSNIVGKPVAVLLTQANATVTLCHSRTRDLAAHVARAEVLVVAVGSPHIVRGEWVRPGAVVDAGINRRDDGTLVGDVEFDVACERASAITPVPGGVGPMTVSMLMRQTVLAAAVRRGIA